MTKKINQEETKEKRPKRSHGEGSLSERSDGTWTARLQIGFKDDGKPNIKAFYGKGRKEVLKKLDDYKDLMKTGVVNENTLPSFDTYILNWLNNIKANELKGLSFDRLESTIKNHITPIIGHMQTNEITDTIIQTEIINPKAKTKSYSSIKKIYDSLNACFKYAVSRRDLRFNPMVTVALPKKVKFINKEMEIFTENEIENIITAASAQYTNGSLKYRNGWGIILMIYTGIRMGEALALKWHNYNEQDQILIIQKNLALIKNREEDAEIKYKLVEQDTLKTKQSERKIPLSKMAIIALTELKKYSTKYIISTKANKPVRPRNIQNTFDSILKDANISHKGLHVTRHTFASLLFKKGADVKTVSELLGHSDTRITYDTYIHLIQEQKVNIINLLD
jgi:integrase